MKMSRRDFRLGVERAAIGGIKSKQLWLVDLV